MAIIGTVRITRVTYLEDDIFEGSIPREAYEEARSEDFEVEDVEEAVAVFTREGLTFAATGNDWAADPDGSYTSNYATGERTETTGHLWGFTDTDTDTIIAAVG